eukprot:941072-Pelagomonas_calceolata.AAC.1
MWWQPTWCIGTKQADVHALAYGWTRSAKVWWQPTWCICVKQAHAGVHVLFAFQTGRVASPRTVAACDVSDSRDRMWRGSGDDVVVMMVA